MNLKRQLCLALLVFGFKLTEGGFTVNLPARSVVALEIE